jgi:phospholipid/cholesterol/gamma-HCH transport system substrate-binding protein
VGVSALLAAAAAILYIALSGGTSHHFYVIVPAANNLLPGNQVTAGAGPIGTVTGIEPVRHGHDARLNIEIDDGHYWPLPASSKLSLRFGGTVSFSNRYILLVPGRRGDATIPDGGELSSNNGTVPVELDTVISKLTPPVRSGIRSLLANGAANMARAGAALHAALPETPPLLGAATGVLGDLTSNEQQLSQLVTSIGHVVNAVQTSSPGLGTLLDGAARTLSAIASTQSQLSTTLGRLPAALRQTRTTLSSAQATLTDAQGLTDRIAPGVAALRRIAQPLDRLLGAVEGVTPPARATLAAVSRSAITSTALGQLASVTPEIGSIGRQATQQLDCIRPYSPEIVGFGTSWADWMSPVDSRDHLVRAQIQNFLPAPFNSDPLTPAQLVSHNPGLTYGFPRPPGTLAGQPWFQPQCGAGPTALNPAYDQESSHHATVAPPALTLTTGASR